MSSALRDPPRRPKGHQPQYFDDPALDQLHAAVLILATELSVAFDRIDTVEQHLIARGGLSPDELDRFVPDDATAAHRDARRRDIAERVLKQFRDYRESLFERAAQIRARQADPPAGSMPESSTPGTPAGDTR
jgi:hypothetical protein